ncbi:Centromere protein S [Beauveria bassiana]|uniref:Apoptosis-inducing TAF9-like domain 1 family protein n=2 Tax=Beauveria TaxID=5581 RepID=J4UV20_BEAB2|nr:apoptosis-inducing TAF9-like domain 1 family protein [Beauveria bassiana ARSEF 2860]EJP69922.1 apoptosis-inducing TAF9-like domain 1 family protein [Beauveria bassiana ARSEF 2860]KAF1730806.1 Centromere protein S [Beauveria bassiana]KAH8715153.1 Centromere protein S [Beauveria bassiana]
MADTMEDDRDRLKSALWYAVGQIVDEECMRRNRNATPQFIGALTELVWTQIENVAVDLESFANHASRSVVTTDDVLLLARKNPDLQQLMQDYINERKTQRGAATGAARKTVTTTGSGRGGRGGSRGGARGGATRLSGR